MQFFPGWNLCVMFSWASGIEKSGYHWPPGAFGFQTTYVLLKDIFHLFLGSLPDYYFLLLLLLNHIFALPCMAEENCYLQICAIESVVKAVWKKGQGERQKGRRGQQRGAEPLMRQLDWFFISWMKMSPTAPVHSLRFDQGLRAVGLGTECSTPTCSVGHCKTEGAF